MIILAKDAPWRARKTRVAMSILSPLHVKKIFFFTERILVVSGECFIRP